MRSPPEETAIAIGVSLQESELLDGTVKKVFRCGRSICLFERGGVVLHYAKSHGHVGGEGLHGIQALVGVLHGALQLANLLLPNVALLATAL